MANLLLLLMRTDKTSKNDKMKKTWEDRRQAIKIEVTTVEIRVPLQGLPLQEARPRSSRHANFLCEHESRTLPTYSEQSHNTVGSSAQ